MSRRVAEGRFTAWRGVASPVEERSGAGGSAPRFDEDRGAWHDMRVNKNAYTCSRPCTYCTVGWP